MFLCLCASHCRMLTELVCLSGYTPLLRATFRGQLSVVRYLLEHKANIEAAERHGMFLNFVVACVCGC